MNLRFWRYNRRNPPYNEIDCFALPGGFLNIDETLEECALRELKEETNINYIEQPVFVGMYDEPNRDERSRVITAAFAIPFSTQTARSAR